MLLSLGLLFLVGMSVASITQKIHLPRILGMLVSGIIIGPYALNLLDPTILNISGELRQIALIIILIKAGLSLNIADLKKVGRPAFLMAFLPASFEIFAYLLFAPLIFSINHIEALLMGSVLAAVSPAIVVPRMVNLIEKNVGTKKSIPQMILAAASLDDVFVIVLFSTFSLIALGDGFDALSLFNIPVSIILGILIGALTGFLLYLFFKILKNRGVSVRNSSKVIIILGISFILYSLEAVIKLPFSGLLAVICMSMMYKFKIKNDSTIDLSNKFGKLWLAAEIILFVLVGASVDISYFINASLPAVLMIFIGLLFRSAAVLLSQVKTNLNLKERIFCVFSYLPKATVQAAIGAVPLSLGLSCGSIILTVAVLSIMITAPLGAILMDSNVKLIMDK